MSPKDPSRRHFLLSAAAVSFAPSLLRPAGASDRLRIGLIGAGGRGTYLAGQVAALKEAINAEIAAVCDVWRPNLEKAKAAAEQTSSKGVKATTRFSELLSWRDIDAVIIATPDFGHSGILKAAAEAGKDAYVEKPICYDLPEAREARDAVIRNKVVVQVGTQRRSDGHHIAACEVVKSGVLGSISRVTVAMNFNEPRWLRDLGGCREQDVDWAAYLFNRPLRPFDARLLMRWHLFRELTNGISGLWMSHFVDAVSWIMDDPFPESAVSNGGVYVWKDDRETSDTFHALLAYPKGWLFSFSMGLGNAAGSCCTINGTNGALDMVKWTLSGAGGAGPDQIKEAKVIQPRGGTDHMRNFLECVSSRKKPTADIEAGWRHAVACVMAARALWTGRRHVYDREKEEIREG